MVLIVSYCIFLVFFTLYSFVLLDPNITLFSNNIWTIFRNQMVYVGYYQRDISSYIYISGIIGLFIFHYLLLRSLKEEKHFSLRFFKLNFKMTPLKLALCIGGILLFSYPLLSHDFFNYLFDAKILTYYHQNPYAHKALDFPHDPWLRFMHWTHRTYPYGPTFLLISLVPSFLSFGKFILAYFFFKIMFVFFYLTSVYTLQKRNTSWGLLFATNPLVIVEGLMNTHNDLIGLALVFIGLYFLQEKKQLLGRIFLVLSIGIKYVTLPFIIFSTIFKKTQVVLALAVIVLMLVWLKFFEIQPWYFLLLLGLIPFYKDAINKSFLFFAGLLFSYYPYMRFGNWSKQFQLDMKHEIILIFFVLNLIYFAINFLRKKFFIK